MKRILAFALMLVLLLGSLVACQKGEDDGEKSTTVSTTTSSTSGGFTDEESRKNAKHSLPSDIKSVTDGKTIRYLARDRSDISFEIDPDLVTDEGLSTAIYNRNAMIESELGVELEVILKAGNFAQKAEYMQDIRNNAQDEDRYDIVTGPNYVLVPLSMEDFFRNIHSLDYINTEAPWWNESFVEECSYQDRLYMIQGELALSMIDSSFVMYFNKSTFDAEYQGENLYDIVKQGKWTFEKFKGYVIDVYGDVGTTSGEKDDGDVFGYVTPSYACGRDGYPTAFGATVTQKDGNGNINFNFSVQRNYDIWEDFYNMLDSSNGVYVNGADDAAREGARSMFQSGKAMFITELLQYSLILRATNVDYGVLPLPKYDDTQENYRTSSESAHTQFSIGAGSSQPEAAAAVLELLCFETYRSVTMEYFQTTLKFKNMQDEESTEILDLIVETIALDFGTQFASALQWPYPVIGTEKDLASFFGQKQQALKPALDNMLKNILALNN